MRALLGSLALPVRSLTGRLIVLRSMVSSFGLVFISPFFRLAPLFPLIALSYGLSGGFALFLTSLIAISGLVNLGLALMAIIPGLSRALTPIIGLCLPVTFALLGLTLCSVLL